MARKKVREFVAKRLLRQHIQRLANIKLDDRSVQVDQDTHLSRILGKFPWLGETKLVVKPDMLFGQRGKSGLLLLDADIKMATAFMQERMGKDVTLKNLTGPVTHFLVEPFIPHEHEYYLSLVVNRVTVHINFSAAGGVEVEENWDKVKRCTLTAGDSIDGVDLSGLLVDVPMGSRPPLEAFIRGCYRVFEELDFTMMEFNPFTIDDKGNVIPLDMRGELDEDAAFRNKAKWGEIEFPEAFGRVFTEEEKFVRGLDEKSGASLKLTVLNPTGRIWLLVAGGGASVIYADTVADLGMGHELGNYGEYSGNPNEEETYCYAKTVLGLATRNPHARKGRVLLIGGGVANFTDIAKTFKGIVHALKEYKEKLRECGMAIYVRRAGPNYKAGLDLMRDVGKQLGVPMEVYGPEYAMTCIIPKALDHVKKCMDA